MTHIQNDSLTTFSIPQGVAENWKDFLNIQAERIVDEFNVIQEKGDQKTTEEMNSNVYQLLEDIGTDEEEIIGVFKNVAELWGNNKITIHFDSVIHIPRSFVAYNILQDILRKIMLEPVVVEYYTGYNGGCLDGGVVFMTKTGYYNIDDILPMLAKLDL